MQYAHLRLPPDPRDHPAWWEAMYQDLKTDMGEARARKFISALRSPSAVSSPTASSGALPSRTTRRESSRPQHEHSGHAPQRPKLDHL